MSSINLNKMKVGMDWCIFIAAGNLPSSYWVTVGSDNKYLYHMRLCRTCKRRAHGVVQVPV